MEQKFYTDNFEQLLRETTDEFRMYPSRKVWHSIYNDIHPSRKWPSASVLLLFIVSLLYISGYHVQRPYSKRFQATQDTQFTALSSAGNNMQAPQNITGNNPVLIQTASVPTGLPVGESLAGFPVNTPSKNITLAFNDQPVALNMAKNLSAQVLGSQRMDIVSASPASPDKDYSFSGAVMDAGSINTNLTVPGNISSLKKTKTDEPGIDEKDDAYKWMQEDVFYNKKVKHSKWKNLSYQLYGTPSFGYRTLKRKDAVPVSQASLVANPEGPVREYVNHDLAMNFEVGANALVRYTKNLRIKAGLQFNFTNYRIRAYELNHPSTATLTLNSISTDQPTLVPHATVFANTPGLYSTVLDNYTLQLSIPVGADYRIAGKKNLQWYAGATFQPTLVTNGNAYLLSSDMNHYVNDNNLLRRFNINGSVETFVSFTTKNGVTLNAGPQVRYQFLSSYSDQYNYDEKLYNIGVKLGVTTNF